MLKVVQMIISEKYKFIFLKPYKVAGSSIEFALSSILSNIDVATYLSKDEEKARQKLFGLCEQNNRKKLSDLIQNFSKQNKRDLQKFKWPKKFHPHCSADDVKSYLGDAKFNDYKKISIVRNPWDYLLSFYHWNPGKERRAPFEQWVFDNRHLIGQNNYQYKINGNCVVDIFLKFENLSEDLSKLPLNSDELSKIKNCFSTTFLKSGYRQKGREIEIDYLKSAKFIDKAIESFCDIELNMFGYQRPY